MENLGNEKLAISMLKLFNYLRRVKQVWQYILFMDHALSGIILLVNRKSQFTRLDVHLPKTAGCE